MRRKHWQKSKPKAEPRTGFTTLRARIKAHDEVAIIGRAQNFLDKVPAADMADRWVMNRAAFEIPRDGYDTIFDMHRDRPKWVIDKYHHLQKTTILRDPMKGFARSMEFPIKELVQAYGTYFTSSVSFLMGLAMLLRYKRIGIYGVDMSPQNVDYVHEWPCVNYYAGMIERDPQVQLIFYEFGRVLPPLYGYEPEGLVVVGGHSAVDSRRRGEVQEGADGRAKAKVG